MTVTHPAALARVDETQDRVHVVFVTVRPFTLVAHHCGQQQDQLYIHLYHKTLHCILVTFIWLDSRNHHFVTGHSNNQMFYYNFIRHRRTAELTYYFHDIISMFCTRSTLAWILNAVGWGWLVEQRAVGVFAWPTHLHTESCPLWQCNRWSMSHRPSVDPHMQYSSWDHECHKLWEHKDTMSLLEHVTGPPMQCHSSVDVTSCENIKTQCHYWSMSLVHPCSVTVL